jgi:hypothetical protein
MNKPTKALSEALFKSGFSNPNGDAAERAWIKAEPGAGYRADIIRGLLRDLGYDVVATR